MNHELRHPLTDLKAGSILRVCDGEGRAIVVFEGRVWITQSGDLRDTVLSAGESFSVDRPGLTLVQAFRDSKLILVEAEARTSPLSVMTTSYELHRRARLQRSAAVGDLLAKGFASLRRAAVRAFTRAPKPQAPRPLTLRRWLAERAGSHHGHRRGSA